MKRISFLFLFISSIAYSQTPTWSSKIAKIIYTHCTECHRTGGIAPFPLSSYANAQANAFGIKVATSSKIMPPWHADPNYNHFKGERVLTAQEITDITDWVNAGAPSGDLNTAPPAPTFPAGIKMQSPDKSISIPTYAVTKNTDDYRCFVIPSGITADKFLAKIEFEPKNLSIVHHILLFQDNAQTCKNLDNADPLPGYSGAGGGVGSNTATLIGGWVPGGNLIDIPANMGIRVYANAYYIMQIHYAPGSMTKKDSTSCHFKYSTVTNPREVFVAPILNHISAVNGGITNGPLFIPANTVKTFNQMFTMDNTADYSIISVAPHMHLIGKSYKTFAVTPLNDTLKLCNIPNWDFHWQGAYTFRKIVKFPKGTKIYGVGVYDNTVNNVYNPSSPPKNVGLGENTTDEMMLCYFTYTNYQTGDENIILDSTLLNPSGIKSENTTLEFSVYPNPANNQVTITLVNPQMAAVSVFDLDGKELLKTDINETEFNLNISQLPQGMYILKITQQGETGWKKVFKW